MRWIIRSFFRLLRRVLAPLMVLGEWLLRPRGVERSPEEQARVDGEAARLTLYQFRTCPFCIKVRWAMRRLALDIRLRDALHDPEAREELRRGGGRIQVPCLRIDHGDGDPTWMYESDDIVAYLDSRFAGAAGGGRGAA